MHHATIVITSSMALLLSTAVDNSDIHLDRVKVDNLLHTNQKGDEASCGTKGTDYAPEIPSS